VIPLFIPYVNRPDLLEKAVNSAGLNHRWQVEVINNSNGPLPVTFAAERVPSVPLTFAQTQNWMLEMASRYHYHGDGTPFYLFMHSDAEAVGDTVQRLAAMANAYTIQGRKWGVIWTSYDALAAFNTAAFREVGGWDVNLSWYLSDVDMYRRIKLAGYECIDSCLPVKHEPSQTLKADPFRQMCVNLEVPFREAYYRAKWGGPNKFERFTEPFGGRMPCLKKSA
jgi:hypothetical protein